MASKTAIGRRAKTLQKYRSQLARFATQYHQLPMDPALLEEFLEGVGGQPATRDTYYRTLSTFYYWLFRGRLITTNPILMVEAPKVPDTTPTILSPGELKRLLTFDGHSNRDRLLLLFLNDSLNDSLHLLKQWTQMRKMGVERGGRMPRGTILPRNARG